MFRWYYKVDAASAKLSELCRARPLNTCRYDVSRTVQEGVVQTIKYNKGTLFIEEIWS